MILNPCLACGACCAYFRVAFYWAEADDATPDGVPARLTESIGGLYCAMQGTNHPAPRCVALKGRIGHRVQCRIYGNRPSPCHQFAPSWIDGQPNPRCDQARAAYGLPPLRPEDWPKPSEDPYLATGT